MEIDNSLTREELELQANCDCVRVTISSRVCHKCGKTAIIPGWQNAEHLVHLTQLKYKLDEMVKKYDTLPEGTSPSGWAVLDDVQILMVEAEEIAKRHGENYKKRFTIEMKWAVHCGCDYHGDHLACDERCDSCVHPLGIDEVTAATEEEANARSGVSLDD